MPSESMDTGREIMTRDGRPLRNQVLALFPGSRLVLVASSRRSTGDLLHVTITCSKQLIFTADGHDRLFF